jgi:hypothetical protein
MRWMTGGLVATAVTMLPVAAGAMFDGAGKLLWGAVLFLALGGPLLGGHLLALGALAWVGRRRGVTDPRFYVIGGALAAPALMTGAVALLEHLDSEGVPALLRWSSEPRYLRAMAEIAAGGAVGGLFLVRSRRAAAPREISGQVS